MTPLRSFNPLAPRPPCVGPDFQARPFLEALAMHFDQDFDGPNNPHTRLPIPEEESRILHAFSEKGGDAIRNLILSLNKTILTNWINRTNRRDLEVITDMKRAYVCLSGMLFNEIQDHPKRNILFPLYDKMEAIWRNTLTQYGVSRD